MTASGDSKATPCEQHCTLAMIRALTRPLLAPPQVDRLQETLLMPWTVRIPLDPDDYTTIHHWKTQKRTELFSVMLDEKPKVGTSTASLHPYFSFGDASSPFFAPWTDVGNCLRNLLLHQVGSHQTAQSMTLISHDTTIFIATASNFSESTISFLVADIPGYYLLRCHHDAPHKKLIFGYHISKDPSFINLVELSLLDDDWRLHACIVLKNLARILSCLEHYTVPLVWSNSDKRTLVHCNGKDGVQKIYHCNLICNIFNATVTNMVHIYNMLDKAAVPHTDRLVSVKELIRDGRVCIFAPVGRSYLPENLDELLGALICVAEALAALHALGVMHRDIRWANVFHALDDNEPQSFTTEWVLFDFEYAAVAPQPAFVAHTLNPGNHAPEMVDTDQNRHTEDHNTSVDIWGLGYLMLHAQVDVPISHAADLQMLRDHCLQVAPQKRPIAAECLEVLRELQARPLSSEKTISEIR